MKTAKEICQEFKDTDINELISFALPESQDHWGICTDERLLANAQKHEAKLRELGFKVDFKELRYEQEIPTWFFLTVKFKTIIRKGFTITACCGEE